jgi:tetratricopeptide (TPR) repeat protein
VALLLLSFGAYEIYDYDAPLHLVTGKYALQDPGSAGKNLFSFTNPGYQWLNDKWLANVVVYLVDAAGGPAVLVLLRMALVLAMGIAIWMAMGNGPGGPGIRLALLSAVPWVAYERFNLRPELFSLVFIPLLIWFVSRPRTSRRDWIAVAALHAVWVNLHGYWIVGLLVLGAFVAGDMAEWWTGWPRQGDREAARQRLRRRLPLLAAAAGGALISPAPLRLFLNPFQVLGFLGEKHEAMGTIAELRSPFDPLAVFNWALPFFVVLVVVGLACLLRNTLRAHPSHWFLFLGFLLMAARNRRNIGMFAVVGAIVAAWSLGEALTARRADGSASRQGRWVLAAALILANAAGSWLVLTDRFYLADVTSRRTGLGMSRLTYPSGMADFLLKERPPVRFFNDFVSGNYLAYRLYPEYQVYIAGNTFKYPPEFFNNYSLITLGGDEYKRAAERYALNAFAIQYKAADMMGLAQRIFNDSNWVPVYFDDNSLVFVRDVPELASFIAAHRVDCGQETRARAAPPPHPARGLFRRVPYPRGTMTRAQFLHRVGHYQLAEMEYRRALEVQPLRDVEHALADVLAEMGRFDEAFEIYHRLLDRRPGFWDRVRLGFEALRGAARGSDEPHMLRDLFRARSGMGSNTAAEQDWEGARVHLEAALEAHRQALQLDPQGDPMRPLEATTRFNLGTTLWRLSQQRGGDAELKAQADSLFDAAHRLQPEDPGLLYRLARTRARQGRRREALTLLTQAVERGGPEYREAAWADEALATLRADPDFPSRTPPEGT